MPDGRQVRQDHRLMGLGTTGWDTSSSRSGYANPQPFQEPPIAAQSTLSFDKWLNGIGTAAPNARSSGQQPFQQEPSVTAQSRIFFFDWWNGIDTVASNAGWVEDASFRQSQPIEYAPEPAAQQPLVPPLDQEEVHHQFIGAASNTNPDIIQSNWHPAVIDYPATQIQPVEFHLPFFGVASTTRLNVVHPTWSPQVHYRPVAPAPSTAGLSGFGDLGLDTPLSSNFFADDLYFNTPTASSFGDDLYFNIPTAAPNHHNLQPLRASTKLQEVTTVIPTATAPTAVQVPPIASQRGGYQCALCLRDPLAWTPCWLLVTCAVGLRYHMTAKHRGDPLNALRPHELADRFQIHKQKVMSDGRHIRCPIGNMPSDNNGCSFKTHKEFQLHLMTVHAGGGDEAGVLLDELDRAFGPLLPPTSMLQPCPEEECVRPQTVVPDDGWWEGSRKRPIKVVDEDKEMPSFEEAVAKRQRTDDYVLDTCLAGSSFDHPFVVNDEPLTNQGSQPPVTSGVPVGGLYLPSNAVPVAEVAAVDKVAETVTTVEAADAFEFDPVAFMKTVVSIHDGLDAKADWAAPTARNAALATLPRDDEAAGAAHGLGSFDARLDAVVNYDDGALDALVDDILAQGRIQSEAEEKARTERAAEAARLEARRREARQIAQIAQMEDDGLKEQIKTYAAQRLHQHLVECHTSDPETQLTIAELAAKHRLPFFQSEKRDVLEGRLFRCPNCSSGMFAKLRLLRRHMRAEHRNKLYWLDYADKYRTGARLRMTAPCPCCNQDSDTRTTSTADSADPEPTTPTPAANNSETCEEANTLETAPKTPFDQFRYSGYVIDSDSSDDDDDDLPAPIRRQIHKETVAYESNNNGSNLDDGDSDSELDLEWWPTRRDSAPAGKRNDRPDSRHDAAAESAPLLSPAGDATPVVENFSGQEDPEPSVHEATPQPAFKPLPQPTDNLFDYNQNQAPVGRSRQQPTRPARMKMRRETPLNLCFPPFVRRKKQNRS